MSNEQPSSKPHLTADQALAMADRCRYLENGPVCYDTTLYGAVWALADEVRRLRQPDEPPAVQVTAAISDPNLMSTCLSCGQRAVVPPRAVTDAQIDNLLFSLRCNWPEDGSHARTVIRDKVRHFIAQHGASVTKEEYPQGAVSVLKPKDATCEAGPKRQAQGTEETGNDRPAAPFSDCPTCHSRLSVSYPWDATINKQVEQQRCANCGWLGPRRPAHETSGALPMCSCTGKTGCLEVEGRLCQLDAAADQEPDIRSWGRAGEDSGCI